jgi:hypothetical protein
MKKIYFMLLSMLFVMLISAEAQVSGIADFYGKYKFAADVEFTTAGNGYKSVLKSECDVEIRNGVSSNCLAEIIGFAGSQNAHKISGIDISGNLLEVDNPNNPQLWSDVFLANINGDNPFGVNVDGEWLVEFFGSLKYGYDPGTKVITVPDFSVVKVTDYKAEKATIIAKYRNVTISPAGDDVDSGYDWEGVYSLSSNVTSYDGNEYPSSFDVKVEYDATGDVYLVTGFMGNDISALNYGGILLTPGNSGMTATLSAGGYLQMISEGSSYIMMMDMNASMSDINLTVNANGTIAVDNFSLVLSGSGVNKTLAYYENVVLRKALPEGTKAYRIKEVNSGKYLHIKSYNANNTTGPTGSVIMSAKSESDDQIFIIEEASGGSCYLLSLSGYYIVCRPWNVDACNDGQKSLLTFNYMDETRFRITNANGYFKVENVGGVVYPFCDAPLSAAATWVLEEVTAETGVDEVKIESVKVKGIYDLTGRRIESITIPGIYIVDGKKVLVK